MIDAFCLLNCMGRCVCRVEAGSSAGVVSGCGGSEPGTVALGSSCPEVRINAFFLLNCMGRCVCRAKAGSSVGVVSGCPFLTCSVVCEGVHTGVIGVGVVSRFGGSETGTVTLGFSCPEARIDAFCLLNRMGRCVCRAKAGSSGDVVSGCGGSEPETVALISSCPFLTCSVVCEDVSSGCASCADPVVVNCSL
jgi:hypothetical protein